MLKLIEVNRAQGPMRGHHAPHRHAFTEIVLYTRGKVSLTGTSPVRPGVAGTVCLHPPGVPHGEASRTGLGSIWVQFEGYQGPPLGTLFLTDPAHAPCRRLMELLYFESLFDPRSSTCRDTLVLLVAYLMRLGAVDGDEGPILALKQRLIANIANPDFRIKDDLFDGTGSATALHQRFKKATGLSPLQYLIELRLRESQTLLRAGGMTLAGIAAQVGFRDPFHFSRAFKQKMGLSPAHYRGERTKSIG